MICGGVVRHSQSDGQRFHRSALAILIVQLFLNKEQLQAAQVDSALDILVQVIRKDEGKSAQPVEVINVKVDQERIKDYLSQTGIYEAFHMNKKCWVSIILDDTLPDDSIQGMIDDDYRSIQGVRASLRCTCRGSDRHDRRRHRDHLLV